VTESVRAVSAARRIIAVLLIDAVKSLKFDADDEQLDVSAVLMSRLHGSLGSVAVAWHSNVM